MILINFGNINNDNFILKAIDGEIKALEFKLKTYQKLSKMDWDGINGGEADKKDTNMNKIINDMISLIKEKLNYIKLNPNKLKDKRNALLSIIDDTDNGIITIKTVEL